MFKIHFKPFWVILDILFFGWKWGGTPILSHFPALFLRFCQFWKFLQVFWTFKGWKKFFFQKCPNYGLLSEKNIKKFPLTFAEIGGGVKRKLTDVNFYFFFEGFPYARWVKQLFSRKKERHQGMERGKK